MEPRIAISGKNRKELARLLNILLSDEYVLYTKTRNFHWNVTGPQFNDLHKFFEAQYGELNGIVDEVAERCRALGAPAFGSLGEFLRHSRIKEQAGGGLSAKEMIGRLLEGHEEIIQNLRKDSETAMDYGDAGTHDFLVALMIRHEKTAWMLRSFLE